MSKRDRAGLYVHIPLCLTRCGYCDFNTYAGLDHLADGYVRALVEEAGLRAEDWSEVAFVSMFLGGGTPTILPLEAFRALMDGLRGSFAIDRIAEVTAEANPDTIDRRYLQGIRRAGVNRLSIGAQSFEPTVLEALERIHGPASVRAAFAAARGAGFDNVNIDLIYGANGETITSWRRSLDQTIALGPDHVSAYALTIEPATPLGRKVAAGLVPPPDPDLQAEMYEVACHLLCQAGFEHYEVSNWARPGRRCLHNMGYWEGRPYLGLGAGAHSFRDDRRWWNVRPPQVYMDAVMSGQVPVGGEETLTEQERRLERLLLGLRAADGIPTEWVDASRLVDLLDRGLVRRDDGRLALTDRGLFLANEVILALAG